MSSCWFSIAVELQDFDRECDAVMLLIGILLMVLICIL